MPPQAATPQPARRRSRLWRWALILAVPGLVLPLMLITIFLGYNMTRPITPPRVFMTDAELAADLPTTSASLVRASSPHPLSAVPPAAPSGATSATQPAPPTPQLIPEAAQTSPALAAAAKKINKDYLQLCAQLEAMETERARRTDPDLPTDKEKKISIGVQALQWKIAQALEKDFGVPWRRRFEQRNLGFFEAHMNWYAAASYCAILCDDWNGTVYYCRKMSPGEDCLMLGTMGGIRLFIRLSDLWDK